MRRGCIDSLPFLKATDFWGPNIGNCFKSGLPATTPKPITYRLTHGGLKYVYLLCLNQFSPNTLTTLLRLMSPKQSQRLQKKITDVKRTLAAEKRQFGGYDDSRGLRYLPTRYYLQLDDYKGGLTYTRWFAKAFPDDIGFPDFLFEWAVLLFKMGKLEQASLKVWQTYCANTYVLDKFFGNPIQPLAKYEWSNLAQAGFTDYFTYSSQQADMLDFSQWLVELLSSEAFSSRQARYVPIHQQLAGELDEESRGCLLQAAEELERTNSFSP